MIVDGKITAVGKDVELPFDAKVVEFEGKTLFPGMVLAHTSGGLDVANENLPVTPFVDVYDSIDPSSLFFESALRQGLTTIGIFQGRNTVVGGMGRAIRPVGLMVEEMTVAASTGLALSTTPKSGYDAMVQAAQMREAFAELDDYIGKLAEKKYDEKLEKDGEKIDVMPEEARERGEKLIEYEDLDDKHRTLYRLTKGEVDAHVHCVRAMDVLKAIAIAEERGFLARTTFVLGPEAHKAADRIKETGRPVVLSPTLTHREYHPITGEESTTFVPAVFADKGIPFALSVNPGNAFGLGSLPYQAARLVAHGIDRETAVAAITTRPAEILGLASRVGDLAPGRDGNVLVLSGDPLALDTNVEEVWINGRKAYDMSEDSRMKRLLEGAKPDMGTASADEGGSEADGDSDADADSTSDQGAEAGAAKDESKPEKKD